MSILNGHPVYTDDSSARHHGGAAFGRMARGQAGGALTDQYPNPGIGLVAASGCVLVEDFARGFGDWSQTVIGAPGPGGAAAAVAPDGWNEYGVVQLTTGSGSAGVGYCYTYGSVASFYRIPPPGSIWATKVRMTDGTVGYELWSGFASAAAEVETTDATQFIGIRSLGGTLRGVVKDGTSSETTVDLGYDCEGSTWRIVGFKVGGTTAAPSVQWFIADEHDSNRIVWDIEHVGDPVTTTIPSTSLFPAFGLITTNTNDKVAQFDFWSLGGRTARG
jgi:hypothetical protein